MRRVSRATRETTLKGIPNYTVKCEAKTKEGLEQIKKIVKDKIDEYPFINLDWNRQYDTD